jgi:glycosyltransferase involved in cell wall biosynthesis
MKEVTIIIPCHNSGIYLKDTLDSIIKNTEYPYKLLLIESESTDGTDKLCDEYAFKYPFIKVMHTKKEGLVKAINLGLKSTDTDVYLTQDDVIHFKLYGRDWLSEMVKDSQKENCGLVISLLAGGYSGSDYIEGLYWAGTWSLYIPRETINRVGYFDEEFNPGCGDDIDYSFRVYRLGLKLIMSNFWVDHHRKTEHFQDNQKLKEEHSKYFKQKWKI